MLTLAHMAEDSQPMFCWSPMQGYLKFHCLSCLPSLSHPGLVCLQLFLPLNRLHTKSVCKGMMQDFDAAVLCTATASSSGVCREYTGL